MSAGTANSRATVKPATWRAALLTLCVLGALYGATVLLNESGFGGASPWYGLWGAYVGGSAQPYHLSVHGVDPGGPADRAGLREGDLVDVRGHTLVERLSLFGQPLSGRPIALRVRRGSQQTRAVIVPGRFDLRRFFNYLFNSIGNVWLLLFAAVIAWRRPYADRNLLLATTLAFAAIGILAMPVDVAWPWAWPYALVGIAGQLFPVSIALWATFASSFARPLPMPRRIALVVTYGLVAIFVLVGSGTADLTMGLATLTGAVTLWFDPTIFIGPFWTIPSAAAVFMGLICSGLALASSKGVERQRAAWSLVPLAALYLAVQMTSIDFQFLSYAAVLIGADVFGIVCAVTPLVLTYVALNRRLIDIGFVMNRTLVFAVLSSIVIGAFVLVEWAASEWFADASRRSSAIAGMIVALALGVSLRFIHKYVDRFVDRVFFRKRHDDEAALHRFAHEATFITDRRVLLRRAVETVRRHAGAADASLLVRNGTAAYVPALDGEWPGAGENDPAIVSLRAWGKPVDLHGVDGTALAGEIAFPAISRGKLMGVLLCGAKRDGEAYAPDETDALLALACGVGAALDTLADENRAELESLHAVQAAILERLARVAETQDRIARRLGS